MHDKTAASPGTVPVSPDGSAPPASPVPAGLPLIASVTDPLSAPGHAAPTPATGLSPDHASGPALLQAPDTSSEASRPGVLRALADMAMAMLLVGATAPLGEIALAGIPLFPALAVRLALAGLALWIFSGRGGEAGTLSPKHWAVLTLQALCGVLVFNVGLWLGMRESGPVAAGVFTSATPAVMAGLGVVLFGERPSLRVLAGIGLTVAGVLAARGVEGLAWTPGIGDALLLAAVCGEAVFLLALRWLPTWLTPMGAAKRVTWIGFALALPAALIQGADAGLGDASAGAWLAVGALGVLVTAGGYVLWFRGVGSVRASQAAAITGLMPVSAVMASWALLGVSPTSGQGLGCLAVGAGIWLAAGKKG
ncbi:DMT family transporter [Fundidesulfovibrio putealis]|uniref:DMT family transporter n=1 Tax=Fundidesulfovibrio putealis TaxID=270496 RepID=UPI00041C34FF|nr:DMT family transporter [Fundidesulfovibrio putealis]